jgi:NAD(P)-dependent dehydrogenase (short-subunit alcohol dehydrogenase family)
MTIDPFRLDGKRVLVTGATSDIGRAIAIACSCSGASVVVTGRNRDRLDQTFGALDNQESHSIVVADLKVEKDRARLVEDAGNIFGVVHAAAVIGPTLLRSISAAFVEERLAVNFVAPMYLTQQLLRGNRVEEGGAIVFISSLSALVGTRGFSIYAGTKAAQMAAARCLALETAKQRIRVNCVAPGIVRTAVYDALGDAWMEEQAKGYPLGLGEPVDVAAATVFLLSSASRWITGQTLVLSGACSWI